MPERTASGQVKPSRPADTAMRGVTVGSRVQLKAGRAETVGTPNTAVTPMYMGASVAAVSKAPQVVALLTVAAGEATAVDNVSWSRNARTRPGESSSSSDAANMEDAAGAARPARTASAVASQVKADLMVAVMDETKRGEGGWKGKQERQQK